MKRRSNKKYWAKLGFLIPVQRKHWIQFRFNLPFVPAGFPVLKDGRNKQWQTALELQFRSWAKGSLENILRVLNEENWGLKNDGHEVD
ncbi:hypothetical protein ACTUHY_05700 [Acidaminococcus sp. LBK-2]|uniref:hypothetical protein n=1 Tax=Acidaminococcus sp. LBK-2 TaxID=3456956 RepID=UPI003FA43DD2